MGPVRRLTYNRGVLVAARALHLSGALRSLYWRFASGPRGVMRISARGLHASLHAPTPGHVRNIEDGFMREGVFVSALTGTLRPGDAFLDVGAQRGVFSILVAKLVGPAGAVIAFEPEAEAHRELLANVSLNRLRNVRTFQTALGGRRGRGRLSVGCGRCPSLVATDAGRYPEDGYQEVEIAEGDRVFSDNCLPCPRSVKIDVEGYEYAVIDGLRRTLGSPACVLVCCEIHPTLLPTGVTIEGIVGTLEELGFRVVELPARSSQMHVVARKGPDGHVSR